MKRITVLMVVLIVPVFFASGLDSGENEGVDSVRYALLPYGASSLSAYGEHQVESAIGTKQIIVGVGTAVLVTGLAGIITYSVRDSMDPKIASAANNIAGVSGVVAYIAYLALCIAGTTAVVLGQ